MHANAVASCVESTASQAVISGTVICTYIYHNHYLCNQINNQPSVHMCSKGYCTLGLCTLCWHKNKQVPAASIIALVPRPSPLRVIVPFFKSGKAWDETSREG